MKNNNFMFYRDVTKRVMDFLLSFFALIILSVVLAVVALLVKFKLGSPVIFKQERIGFSEKRFTMYKFRTMTDKRDESGHLMPDDVRLTKFGKFLRSTSLDELPELFNILKGDMSLVGPRPLLVEYLEFYDDHQKRRHEVKPGLTGLAQVSGRNAISWEEKFNLDVKYVDSISISQDTKIFFTTIKKVFGREDINSDSSVTMEKFKGSPKQKLLIIGASGHGKVIADVAFQMNKWDSVSFLDDNIQYDKKINVIGGVNDFTKYIDEYDMVVGIGNNEFRNRIHSQLEDENAKIATIIHPSAIISNEVEIAQGTVIMAGAIINYNVKIGKSCIINTGATLDHDNVIEDFVHISPGSHLAGSVTVGQETWLGVGSVVSNNINIASRCKIGAGTVVIKDINEAGTYVGSPARRVLT